MNKTDVNDLLEQSAQHESICQFKITPEDMLDGTLLGSEDGQSITDQQWAIKVALSATKEKLGSLIETYQTEKSTHANYQDGEYLHDLFERIRYLSGIYSFQYFTLQSSFIENIISHSYFIITGTKYNNHKGKGKGKSKIQFILEELSKSGVTIIESDIEFFHRFYQARNKFSHNQIEIPSKEVEKLIKELPGQYWDVYERNGKPFFLTIADALEIDFDSSLSRLLESLGQHLLSKGSASA